MLPCCAACCSAPARTHKHECAATAADAVSVLCPHLRKMMHPNYTVLRHDGKQRFPWTNAVKEHMARAQHCHMHTCNTSNIAIIRAHASRHFALNLHDDFEPVKRRCHRFAQCTCCCASKKQHSRLRCSAKQSSWLVRRQPAQRWLRSIFLAYTHASRPAGMRTLLRRACTLRV